MTRPARVGSWLRLWSALLAALLLASACTSSAVTNELSGPGGTPERPREPPVSVDVCDLITPQDVALLLGRQNLVVVGTGYTAARVPTFRCELGRRFAEPQLTMELATGPIAPVVFERSYGASSGGDPVIVRRVGAEAFLRSETDALALHAFVNGSIVSLTAASDIAKPLTPTELSGLARLAVGRIPANPVLEATSAGARCSGVASAAVTAAVGSRPRLASHFVGPDGSLICSWASRPGSAVVTLHESAATLAAFRASLDASAYLFDDIAPDVRMLSRSDRAGDVVLLQPPGRLTFVSVVPTAGYSDAAIGTTAGEKAFVRAVVSGLG